MEIGGSALVTGASRGIGRGVALELAARGFTTVATMRDVAAGKELAEEAEGRLVVARLDVTDPATYEFPDDLRILVNNAGVDSAYLPVEHSEDDDWRALFETNVLGAVKVTSAAIPVLRANRPAVVCNVTSSSILAAVPFYSAYRAMADEARALREENADSLVVSPSEAAASIVDAILDDGGPLRYGCDPLSVGFLDLWRQSDDETMFELTGRSFLQRIEPEEG